MFDLFFKLNIFYLVKIVVIGIGYKLWQHLFTINNKLWQQPSNEIFQFT